MLTLYRLDFIFFLLLWPLPSNVSEGMATKRKKTTTTRNRGVTEKFSRLALTYTYQNKSTKDRQQRHCVSVPLFSSVPYIFTPQTVPFPRPFPIIFPFICIASVGLLPIYLAPKTDVMRVSTSSPAPLTSSITT